MKVIVFDFDDTLFASTYINMFCTVDDEGKLVYPRFPELSESIIRLLTTAQKHADKIFIITNAENTWIPRCLEEVIPECKQIFEQITISHRANIAWDEMPYSNWKTANFILTLSPYFKDEL